MNAKKIKGNNMLKLICEDCKADFKTIGDFQ